MMVMMMMIRALIPVVQEDVRGRKVIGDIAKHETHPVFPEIPNALGNPRPEGQGDTVRMRVRVWTMFQAGKRITPSQRVGAAVLIHLSLGVSLRLGCHLHQDSLVENFPQIIQGYSEGEDRSERIDGHSQTD